MERNRKMLPIGPLMIEHRLIERMIRRIGKELARMKETGRADVGFLTGAVDFIRFYADRCHHGKEEHILFRELDKKDLLPEERRQMEELVEDHILARGKVAEVVAATARYANGDKNAVHEIIDALAVLVDFYPVHIAKEDKDFFLPVMAHFTPEEKDAMLREGVEFDASLIHEKYRAFVDGLEKN